MAQTIRFEGLSLPVSDVARSVAFYQQFGFQVELYGPQFALLRLGEGTLGLLKSEVLEQTHTLRERIHIELSTDHLDELYAELQGRGVIFLEPPHDEPWERAMATPDPDGYHLEIAQGRRGHNAPGTS
jgi:catechol 2,3-dioxygenase-like lactoylglutathione lyase family enzyme